MLRLILIPVFLWASVLYVTAQNTPLKVGSAVSDDKPSGSVPSLEQILDKYVQAIGGKAALERLTTRVIKASLVNPSTGEKTAIEIYQKTPNKWLTITNTSDRGRAEVGFNSTVGWLRRSIGDMRETREMEDSELIERKRILDIHRGLRLKETYSRLAMVGKEKMSPLESYAVETNPSDCRSEKIYFDTKTGLLVRNDVRYKLPEGGDLITEIYFENYKEVDAVKVPFTIRLVTQSQYGGSRFTIQVNEIKHNDPIDDARFEKPK